jgi:hypothetical protein
MVKTPLKHLGTGKCDAENVKARPFFKGVNWVRLKKRYKNAISATSSHKQFPRNMSMQILGYNILLGT